jgi:hypothetical protein
VGEEGRREEREGPVWLKRIMVTLKPAGIIENNNQRNLTRSQQTTTKDVIDGKENEAGKGSNPSLFRQKSQ